MMINFITTKVLTFCLMPVLQQTSIRLFNLFPTAMHSANYNNNNNDLLVIHPQSGSSLTKMLSVHSAKMYTRHHFRYGQLYNLSYHEPISAILGMLSYLFKVFTRQL